MEDMKVRGAWVCFPVGVTFWIFWVLSWFCRIYSQLRKNSNTIDYLGVSLLKLLEEFVATLCVSLSTNDATATSFRCNRTLYENCQSSFSTIRKIVAEFYQDWHSIEFFSNSSFPAKSWQDSASIDGEEQNKKLPLLGIEPSTSRSSV